MKYMILLYGSQLDYDVLAGRPTGKPPMSAAEVAAMHAQMNSVHDGNARRCAGSRKERQP